MSLIEIQNQHVQNNENFFKEKGIVRSKKGKYCLLNYGQCDKPNEFNMWTRGLVLDEFGKICSLPFVRFFNKSENEKLNFENCKLLEKLDGTLIGVFFDENDNLIIHTRKTISTFQDDYDSQSLNFDGKKFSHLKLANEYLKNIKNWNENRKNLCWSFELIHGATKIITDYTNDRWGLHLLNVRNLNSLEEWSYEDMKKESEFLNCMIPKEYPDVNSIEEFDNLMSKMPNDFEGFVILNTKNFQRIKLKNKEYCQIRLVLGQQNYKTLLPIYLENRRDDIEALFPETKILFEKINFEFCQIMKEITIACEKYKSSGRSKSRKEIVMEIRDKEPKWIQSIILHFLNKKDEDFDEDILKQLFLRFPTHTKMMEQRLEI